MYFNLRLKNYCNKPFPFDPLSRSSFSYVSRKCAHFIFFIIPQIVGIMFNIINIPACASLSIYFFITFQRNVRILFLFNIPEFLPKSPGNKVFSLVHFFMVFFIPFQEYCASFPMFPLFTKTTVINQFCMRTSLNTSPK